MSTLPNQFPGENASLILGYGNPLRSDDAIGRILAERLQDLFPELTYLVAHQLLPEYAEPISGAGHVFFIDAGAGPNPGELTVQPLAADEDDNIGRFHDFTPAALLAYARELYGRVPRATMITVSGFSFAHGDSLSPPMLALLPELLARVAAAVKAQQAR